MLTSLFTYFSWLDRDAKLIILARAVRTFGQSYVAVLMALYLDLLGFNLFQIGAFLSVGVAGVAFFAFIVGLISDMVGRRRLLIIFSLASGGAGLALFLTNGFVPMVIISFWEACPPAVAVAEKARLSPWKWPAFRRLRHRKNAPTCSPSIAC